MRRLPHDVRLRLARDADAIAVAALCLQQGRESALASTGAAVADAGFIDRFADAWLAQRGRRITWIAECVNGRPVGAASAAVLEGLPRPGGQTRSWLHLTTFYVTADLRGQGVGRALLDAALAEARVMGVEGVRVDAAHEAVGLYEQVGFQHPSPGLLELRLRL